MAYRIQFDIEEDELERMMPYILKAKNRHTFAEKALNEWINRQEGRNRRRIMQEEKYKKAMM